MKRVICYMRLLILGLLVLSLTHPVILDYAVAEAAANGSTTLPVLPAVPANSRVFFENLTDGQIVTSPVKIKMGVEGIMVDKAGLVERGQGHHHLIIDKPLIDTGLVVPGDEHHLHFGQGQTETTIDLTPGKHTLSLQFADGAHRSYGPQLSATISIDVAPRASVP